LAKNAVYIYPLIKCSMNLEMSMECALNGCRSVSVDKRNSLNLEMSMECALNVCRSVIVDKCDFLNHSFNNQIHSRGFSDRYSFKPKLRLLAVGVLSNY